VIIRFVATKYGNYVLIFSAGIRIYYTLIGKKIVLLLGGGNKSTQDKDINRAIKCLSELTQKGGN